MKAYKSILSLSNLSFVALFAYVVASVFSMSFLPVFGAAVATSFVMPKGVAFMAITKEIWTKDIVDNLYKNNEFAQRAFNADMYVLLGKVVHIPVAGAASAVKKNLTSFPQTAVKRTDSDITYAIDTFYSVPRHIENIEKYELSYDKRQSALGEDQAALIQSAMDSLLYRWAPLVANTVLTAGADSAEALLAGATGTRKKFTKAALSTIKVKMDKANIPINGRIALLTADHYNQFLDSLSEAERTEAGRVADMTKGIVGKYLGFDIMMRSTVLRYRGADGAYVVVDEQDENFAANIADRSASLVYQESCVERAKGSVEIFDNAGNAEYYGDIYSMTLRLGGRIRRTAGVYAVVEAYTAA